MYSLLLAFMLTVLFNSIISVASIQKVLGLPSSNTVEINPAQYPQYEVGYYYWLLDRGIEADMTRYNCTNGAASVQ